MIRRLVAVLVASLVFVCASLEPREAEAQEIPIVGAVALIGGGLAIAIGNGYSAINQRPPKGLWADAGWALGFANIIVGVIFLVDSQSDEPVPGALPIGVGLTSLGAVDIGVTAWAVSYDGRPSRSDDYEDEWERWRDPDFEGEPTSSRLRLPAFRAVGVKIRFP